MTRLLARHDSVDAHSDVRSGNLLETTRSDNQVRLATLAGLLEGLVEFHDKLTRLGHVELLDVRHTFSSPM